ncbi:MAG: hypothetical protein ABF290_02700 [Thiogranum sp.]
MSSWPDRQGGAVTLIGALFIIITLALMVEVIQRMAASDVLDTAVQNDAVAALFIAETGIEHASYLYANGTICGDLSLVNNVATGQGEFDITSSALVGTDCQIRVRGEISSFGVQRVIEATLKNDGGNLLLSANPDFEEPPGTCVNPCRPTGWNDLPAGGWDDNGGPTGTGDRAAYVIKPNNGSGTATTAGTFGLTAFTVTAPAVLTLDFDYKVLTSGNSPQEAQLSFNLSDGVSSYPASPAPFKSGNTGNYITGNVTFSIGGSGPVTFTEFGFTLFAKSGKSKQIWLDNLLLQGPGGGSAVSLHRWREVVSN